LEYDRQLVQRIIETLSQSATGMTISDVARSVQVSRNTAAKYLHTLAATGDVVFKRVSSAKLYFPSTGKKTTRLIDVIEQPMLVVDRHMSLTRANDAFQRMFGLSEEELRRKKLRQILANPSWNKVSSVIRDGPARGGGTSLELSILTHDGPRRVVGLIQQIILDDGTEGYCIIVRCKNMGLSTSLFDDDPVEVANGILDTHPDCMVVADPETGDVLLNSRRCNKIIADSGLRGERFSIVRRAGDSWSFDVSCDLKQVLPLSLKIMASGRATVDAVRTRIVETIIGRLLVIRGTPRGQDVQVDRVKSLLANTFRTIAEAVGTFVGPVSEAKRRMHFMNVVPSYVSADMVIIGYLRMDDNALSVTCLWAGERLSGGNAPASYCTDTKSAPIPCDDRSRCGAWLVAACQGLGPRAARLASRAVDRIQSTLIVVDDPRDDFIPFALVGKIAQERFPPIIDPVLRSLSALIYDDNHDTPSSPLLTRVPPWETEQTTARQIFGPELEDK